VQALVDLLPLPAVARDRVRESLCGEADEAGERGGMGPGERRGPLQRFDQRQPVTRAVAGEHAARAGDHRRDPGALERLLDDPCLVVGAHEHRQIAGCDRTAVGPRVARQKSDGVGGEIGGDVGLGARAIDHPPPVLDHQRTVARHDAEAHRLPGGRPGQA
jgi:hypothetical protein